MEIGGSPRFCAGGRSPALVGDDTGCVTGFSAAPENPYAGVRLGTYARRSLGTGRDPTRTEASRRDRSWKPPTPADTRRLAQLPPARPPPCLHGPGHYDRGAHRPGGPAPWGRSLSRSQLVLHHSQVSPPHLDPAPIVDLQRDVTRGLTDLLVREVDHLGAVEPRRDA